MMFQKKMADAFDSARTFFTTACGRMRGSGQPEGISSLENRLMQFCSRRQPLRIYADTCSLLCADGEALLTAAERVLPQYQAQLLIFQSVLAELESVGQKTPAQRQNCQRVLARLQSLERAGVVRVCIGRNAGFSDPNFISDFVQDMLTSNVLFGQGSWTPWQMFAMGLVGFFAGLLFCRGPLRPTRPALCCYGALASIVLYGGIMNPASALMWAHTLSWKLLLSYYLTGLPWDIVRAAATVIFLWLMANPMLEKLTRIQQKYGLLEP